MDYEFKTGAEDDGMKLASFLKLRAGLSLTLMRSLKHIDGAIRVDGAPAHTNLILCANQTVSLQVPEKRSGLSLDFEEAPILYESAEALVYDKRAGLAVHPTLGYPDGTLANIYAARLNLLNEDGVFRPINRLDKNTSGALLAAKTRLAAPHLAKSSRKLYLAVCEGEIEKSDFIIDAPIACEESSIIKRCVSEGGKTSRTRVRVLARGVSHSLIAAETLTGRTHQIRVHMSHLGFPLAGDELYGGSRALIARHALHCALIEFKEPFAERASSVGSPLPEDMRRLLKVLGMESCSFEVGF